MLNNFFPNPPSNISDVFSDVGNLGISSNTRNIWENELRIRQRYWHYYSGDIFKEKIPEENPNDPETPLLYPVGINIAKMLCMTMADSIFGEWAEDVVTFEVSQDREVEGPQKDAVELLQKIVRASEANHTLWEMELERNIYGGAVMKIMPDFKSPGKIVWRRVPLNAFFPVWNPDEIDDLLEVYVITRMTKEQARLQWGIHKESGEGVDDSVIRVEYWNKAEYWNEVDGKRVSAYSGKNPWGIVPFVYIPRLRSDHWWGESLIEDIMNVQDELNMRIADLGEAINYNTHPIKWGFNLPKSFKAENYPVGPGVFWDLGRAIGQSPEPKVDLLEADNPIPSGTFEYITFLYDWTRISSFAPPIALGEDQGGGQRSGITLEIRMTPLIKAIRRSRSYFASGLKRAAKISALILKQKNFSDIPSRALERIIRGELSPKFANVLPRDKAAIVDEVIKRLATTPPSISIETAVKKLGDGTTEVERIKQMIEDDALYRENPLDAIKQAEPSGVDGKVDATNKADSTREGGGE